MRWVLFLSRLAFIAGFCFLLSLSQLFRPWIGDQDLAATIITIGFFMGMLLVPAALLSYLLVLIRRRKLTEIVPAWLVAMNIVWLFLYLVYLIFLNGQNNHPA